MLDIMGALKIGVNGFFVAAGFILCAIAIFGVMLLICTIFGLFAKVSDGGDDDE